MLKKNKTFTLLRSLPIEDQENLLNSCKKESKDFVMKFQQDVERIKTERLEMMRLERQELLEKEAKEAVEVEMSTNKMMDYGFWDKDTNIDAKINSIEVEEEKRQALIFQIQFRKKVVRQIAKATCFTVNSNNRKLTIEELKQKITHLISLDGKFLKVSNPYVGKTFSHKFIASSPEDVADEKVEYDGVFFNMFYGKVESAFRASLKSPLIYLLKYNSFEDTYGIEENEFQKDLIEEQIIFTEENVDEEEASEIDMLSDSIESMDL